MLELELKGVVTNLEQVVEQLEALGARRVFVGRLEDRRLDDILGSFRARDEMFRVRVYRSEEQLLSASLDWKGPASYTGGYKEREEINAPVAEPGALLEVLAHAGFRTALAIDRWIWQYALDEVIVRLERYPRMDDLAEIEGKAEAMERVIGRLGLERAAFSGDSIFAFARRFEERTGLRAILADTDPGDRHA